MRLAPAPAEGSAVVIDWEQFEGSLGVTLPSDYKWLIEAYGPGTFDDFFYVLQPASPFEPIRLAESARRQQRFFSSLPSMAKQCHTAQANSCPSPRRTTVTRCTG
jgi:hypothetical protein